MSGVFGCFTYTTVYQLVLKHADSQRRAQLAAPVFVFLVTFVVALFTIYKGGKGLGLHKTSVAVAIIVAAAIGIVSGAITYPFVKWWALRLKNASEAEVPAASQETEEPTKPSKDLAQVEVAVPETPIPDGGEIESGVVGSAPDEKNGVETVEEQKSPEQLWTEQLFTGLTVIMAAFFSLAHGANDVANSVGPFGAVLAAYDGPLKKKSETPIWVFVVAGVMITVGLATYGIHVMRTIGTKITPVTPPKAFCVNFSATLVVLIATRLGIPISTTHASVGAVVGVGLADGVKNVNWTMMLKVLTSWILTLPIVGVTAAGAFALFLPVVVETPFPSP